MDLTLSWWLLDWRLRRRWRWRSRCNFFASFSFTSLSCCFLYFALVSHTVSLIWCGCDCLVNGSHFLSLFDVWSEHHISLKTPTIIEPTFLDPCCMVIRQNAVVIGLDVAMGAPFCWLRILFLYLANLDIIGYNHLIILRGLQSLGICLQGWRVTEV